VHYSVSPSPGPNATTQHDRFQPHRSGLAATPSSGMTRRRHGYKPAPQKRRASSSMRNVSGTITGRKMAAAPCRFSNFGLATDIPLRDSGDRSRLSKILLVLDPAAFSAEKMRLSVLGLMFLSYSFPGDISELEIRVTKNETLQQRKFQLVVCHFWGRLK
jgi:hypothetical protein